MPKIFSGRDLVAGISVAGLMLPEAIAYAGIAGVPPQHALFAAIAGCTVYALFGQSRFAIISPTSSSAAILASMLVALAPGFGQKMLLVAMVVFLVGILFLAAGLLKLGALATIISRPVLRGFAFGLAILITVKQFPVLFGIPEPSTGPFEAVWLIVTQPAHWNAFSLSVGVVALALLIIMRRTPLLPGSLIVIIAAIFASITLDLQQQGVAIVGVIDLSSIWASVTAVSFDDLSRVVRFAPPLVLILFAESWGTVRGLSIRHGEPVDANRELRTLGLANLASAALQGMPVGAGFSAGAANEAANPQTRLATAIAAFGLAVFTIAASGWFAYIPRPALAAIVIVALLHALDPAPLYRLWKLKRDVTLALAATAGVLFLGVLNGVLVAIALSFAVFLQRLSMPSIMRLGRLGNSHDFVDAKRHPDALELPGILILRPAQPLFFGNAEPIFAAINRHILASPVGCTVIVSLEETFEVDTTALDALLEFDANMQKRGVALRYARMHDAVKDMLILGGGEDLLRRSNYSVDDAVAATRKI
jgi:high affinity sulfate transporter 1